MPQACFGHRSGDAKEEQESRDAPQGENGLRVHAASASFYRPRIRSDGSIERRPACIGRLFQLLSHTLLVGGRLCSTRNARPQGSPTRTACHAVCHAENDPRIGTEDLIR